MKLIKVATLFVIITVSLFLVQNLKINSLEEAFYKEKYIRTVLENAAEDAAITLKESSNIYGISSENLFEIKEQEVFNEFMKSLAASFGAVSEIERIQFNRYVPLMIILAEDGYYTSVIDKVVTDDGVYLTRVVSPKKYYSFEREDVYYFFKLSGEATILYQDVEGNLNEVSGSSEEILSNSMITVDTSFINNIDVKKYIVERLNEDIIYSLKAYNSRMKKYGKKIDLNFSSINDRLNTAVDSPSFLVVFSSGEKGGYSDMGIIGSCRFRIKRNDFYVGFEKNGIKYFARKSELKEFDDDSSMLFLSRFEAAKNGYYEYLK